MGVFSEEPGARLAILAMLLADRFRSEHNVCAIRTALLAKTFGVSSVVRAIGLHAVSAVFRLFRDYASWIDSRPFYAR